MEPLFLKCNAVNPTNRILINAHRNKNIFIFPNRLAK